MLQLSFNFLQRQLDRLKPSPPATRTEKPKPAKPGVVAPHGITVNLVRRPCARRYLLSLQADGTARLVIPRRGTEAEALRFLERSDAWLLHRHEQWKARAKARQPWQHGSNFLYRGENVTLSVEPNDQGVILRFAGQAITLPGAAADYRKPVQACLRRLAETELPPRTRELAKEHSIAIGRVSVRAQKSRWGSCSARGTISLNWRLIHAPPFVVDYLIIHELMHRREMNHSKRYWKHVAAACPDYRTAEKWLKSSKLDLREV